MAFGSLYMASGKRYAEMILFERSGVPARRVLRDYTPQYLRFVWTLSSTALVVFYALWAAGQGETYQTTLYAISIVPFALAVLRFGIDVDRGSAGEPEEIVWGDRSLQILALLWLMPVVYASYLP